MKFMDFKDNNLKPQETIESQETELSAKVKQVQLSLKIKLPLKPKVQVNP